MASFLKKWTAVFCSIAVFTSIQATHLQDDVMVKMEDKTFVINTTTLCKQVKGLNGTTPLLVYIKNNKIVKIESLPNKETPSYYDRAAKELFALYVGMNVKKKTTIETDGTTGATYSSNAIQGNIETAMDYYLNHK